jgi:hypothetical protein
MSAQFSAANPMRTDGFEFVEYAAPDRTGSEAPRGHLDLGTVAEGHCCLDMAFGFLSFPGALNFAQAPISNVATVNSTCRGPLCEDY